ncbi:MAG: L-threonylcarbamoyladenylate synthase [Anaerolineae bacterium]
MTRILPADQPSIAQAAALIRAGEVVAFPTETVYGLGANALDAAAVAKIFAAKGRPSNDPLIVHIADLDQLALIAKHVPDSAAVLIEAFWAGPLTLILPRTVAIPSLVSAGLPTVGVRMPAHPVAQALIRAAGVPIAAPSANRFAHTSPTTAQHVYDDLNGTIPLILDGGATHYGVESTILDLSGTPRLLRPGGITAEELRFWLPDLQIVERHSDDAQPMIAPGMLLKHYAPTVPLTLFEGEPSAVRQALRDRAEALLAAGQRVGLLLTAEDIAEIDLPTARIVSLGSQSDLPTIARHLYSALRSFEQPPLVDHLLARSFPAQGLGLAIRDRLMRAAAGHMEIV